MVNIQKAKNPDRILGEATVRRNVVDYQELMNNDRNNHLINHNSFKEPAKHSHNKNENFQSSAVLISSADDFRGIFDRSDDINNLMKDLHTENDEVLQNKDTNRKQIHVDIQPKPVKIENKVEESGQFVLDTLEFEKLIGEKSNHFQENGNCGKFCIIITLYLFVQHPKLPKLS